MIQNAKDSKTYQRHRWSSGAAEIAEILWLVWLRRAELRESEVVQASGRLRLTISTQPELTLSRTIQCSIRGLTSRDFHASHISKASQQPKASRNRRPPTVFCHALRICSIPTAHRTRAWVVSTNDALLSKRCHADSLLIQRWYSKASPVQCASKTQDPYNVTIKRASIQVPVPSSCTPPPFPSRTGSSYKPSSPCVFTIC